MKTKQFLRAFGSLFFILCAVTLNAGEHPTLKERIILAAEKNGITVSDFSEGKISENPQFEIYTQKLVFYIEQPIDHTDPKTGTFKQKVVVMHCGYRNPSLLITEGYNSRGESPAYSNELSALFNTNIVEVEHRYFGNSIPFMQRDTAITFDTLNWDYMTAKNEAADLHNVVRLFKEVYKGKWIATGISKGGQTAMFYTAYYPEDMDITVPYVGPVCFAKEDGRHEPFIAGFAGTAPERESIRNFQIELLERRSVLEPMMENLVRERNYKFNRPVNEIYDYCVLEFPFAFWQWGTDPETIPDPDRSTDSEIFDYFMKISDPSYFVAQTPTTPFFVQAAKELGYYGYDTRPFKKLLTIKSARNYMDSLLLPKQEFKFDKYLYKDINSFLDTTSSKMVFVYGEYDPWSAVMPKAPVKNEKLKKREKGRNTMFLFIDPHGSHRARINTLPEEKREKAVSIIKNWIDE